eukprot:CAMPEP_0173243842 /NCGR_PEP_ID=MMETSP1142-20121109/15751_1 /TAXON_ID=483371 /ORGANISM="non described non described, Strain CCMP2298" /LENGTH=67 /DNA_ID=CAMNT_0014175529 /DNA_START=44 /DNA_END=244 /DNA_ORIENTATION=-
MSGGGGGGQRLLMSFCTFSSVQSCLRPSCKRILSNTLSMLGSLLAWLEVTLLFVFALRGSLGSVCHC